MSDRVPRFNRTERWVHAVQAITFLLLAFTGLAISINSLETLIGHRALMRQVHLTAAFFFVFGPALVALAGDRLSIREDARQVDQWTKDDVRWLAHPTIHPTEHTPPQGRYNAGQKLNAVFTVYSTLTFTVTGLIVWQNRRFSFQLVSQANAIHQALTYLAILVFMGHIFLSVILPATRPSLSGIITGTIRADWARLHHPNWNPARASELPPAPSAIARSLALLVIGLEAALLVTRFGFEWLGANGTDAVVKLIYRFSGLPGTLPRAATGVHTFDLAALIWLGLAVALWYGAMRKHSLLPRIFSSPAKG